MHLCCFLYFCRRFGFSWMMTPRTYIEDLQIARALIRRDEAVTRHFFYKQCYPLFKYFYNRFVTGCESCKEFIDEIYLLVMAPSRLTGKCKLEGFRGESTLTCWLRTVCQFYCCAKFKEQEKKPVGHLQLATPAMEDEDPEQHDARYGFVEMDFSRLDRHDVITLLNQMPNKRYSSLIRLRYLEQMSNEETAALLGMTLDNYYNKHKLAKAQYEQIYRKEYHHV